MTNPDKTNKGSSALRELLSWIQIIVIAAVVAFVLNNFLIANSRVPTGSMENTIMTGDRVIGSRLSYRFGEPKRGDVIIFHWPDDEKMLFVKRIIGMPGDKVTIRDGHVYLNRKALTSVWGITATSRWTPATGKTATSTKTKYSRRFCSATGRESRAFTDTQHENRDNTARCRHGFYFGKELL